MSTTERFASHGHEPRDVSLRPVVVAGLGLLGAVLVVAAGGWWLFRHYEAREARLSAPASPLAAEAGVPVPPEPRLQAEPRKDLEALRAEERARLEGYGWVDPAAGIVRIPIERAMALLAERAGKAAP
jgi:hypothetical protein